MTLVQIRTPLAVALEALSGYAALALFVAAFGTGDGPAPSLLTAAVVVVLSFSVSRALQLTDLDDTRLRFAGLGITAIAIAVIARLAYASGEWLWDIAWLRDFASEPTATFETHAHVVAGVAGLTLLWFRGITRGQEPIEYDGVLASASAGLVAVALAAIATPNAEWPRSFGALALIYAVLAAVTLAIYHAPEPETPLRTFVARWSTGLAAIVAIAAALTIGAVAFDPDSVGFLEPVARPIATALETLLLFVLAPFILVIDYAVRGIAWLFGWLLPDNKPPEQEPLEPAADPEDAEPRDQPIWATIITWVALIAGGIAGTFIAVLLAWFAFRRFTRRPPPNYAERRESVESASTLGEDLNALLDAMTRRFRRRTARSQPGAEVRRLYYEMLDRAAADGLERPPSATPLQFAPPLDAHFSSDAPTSITEAFAESRYGARDIEETRLAALRAQWQAIQRP